MKVTKENILALKKMGFEPDNEKKLDDWWTLIDVGWTFRLDCMPNIKTLTTRLIKYHYTMGYDEGKEGHSRLYRYRTI
jgi:hypothetical protein